MNIDTILASLPVLFFAIIGYFGKAQIQRIDDVDKRQDDMEKNLALKMSEQQTRQIVSDRYDPIKESLQDVKDQLDKANEAVNRKLDKVYDLLLNGK